MVTKRNEGWLYLYQIKQVFSQNQSQDDHYIVTEGSIHENYIAIINIYAPNIREPKCEKQILREWKEAIE